LQARGVRAAQPTVVFVHGSSRADKLWPEESWIDLGARMIASGFQVALPHAGADELARAERLANALGSQAVVWPAMPLDALVDHMGGVNGVIGVDSGLSHIAVALNLPHVQLYNFPTAWRTGPTLAHGNRHQVAVERDPTPEVDLVWATWQVVRRAEYG
jgi:heptosyltransferase I